MFYAIIIFAFPIGLLYLIFLGGFAADIAFRLRHREPIARSVGAISGSFLGLICGFLVVVYLDKAISLISPHLIERNQGLAAIIAVIAFLAAIAISAVVGARVAQFVTGTK